MNMNMTNTNNRWGLIAQGFHWLMFLLIIGAWFAVETREDFPKGSPERDAWMLLHKSLGLSIFFLVWLRIGVRFTQVTPADIGAGWQQKAAKLIHLGLYAVMIAMPITGMLASQFFGKPVSWFGVFELPMLVSESKDLGEVLEEVHETGFIALLVLLTAHVGAALYHHFILKDDVLKRMLPWGK